MLMIHLRLRHFCFTNRPVVFLDYFVADELEFFFLKGHVPLLNNPPQPEDAEMLEEPEAMLVDPDPVDVADVGKHSRANVDESTSTGLVEKVVMMMMKCR